MNRPERRRKIKECEKELKFILKHTPYLKLKTNEFDLPMEEIGMLMDGVHEDQDLQKRFDLVSKIFTRVDQLNQMIEYLKQSTSTEAHPVHSIKHSPHPHNVLLHPLEEGT
jgi:hypothetical protein